ASLDGTSSRPPLNLSMYTMTMPSTYSQAVRQQGVEQSSKRSSSSGPRCTAANGGLASSSSRSPLPRSASASEMTSVRHSGSEEPLAHGDEFVWDVQRELQTRLNLEAQLRASAERERELEAILQKAGLRSPAKDFAAPDASVRQELAALHTENATCQEPQEQASGEQFTVFRGPMALQSGALPSGAFIGGDSLAKWAQNTQTSAWELCSWLSYFVVVVVVACCCFGCRGCCCWCCCCC
ncbi:unnamed protein product, partial [Polarella glacialis]